MNAASLTKQQLIEENQSLHQEIARLEQELLEDQAERQNKLLDNVFDAVILTDLQFKIVEWNKSAQRLYGWKRNEVLNRPVGDITKIEYPFHSREDVIDEFQSKGSWKGEVVQQTKDGKRLNVFACVSFIEDNKKKPIGIIAINRDVTEQKKIQEKLEELAKFPSENPNPVLRISKDGMLLFHNKASRPILKKWAHTKNQPLTGEPLDQVEHAFKTGRPLRSEIECGIKTYSLTFVPMKELDFVNAYGLDITEMKQAEEHIATLAKFPTENPNPVMRIARDGTLLFSNQASIPILRVWEHTKEKRLLGEPLGIIKKTLRTNRLQRTELDSNGSIFSLTFAPVKDSGFVNVYGLDITEMKQAEERIVTLAKFPTENPNPVMRIARDGTLLFSNQASIPILQVWEYTKDEHLIGDPFATVKKTMRTNKLQRTELASNGRIFSLTFAPVKDAGFVNVYGLDITDRKRAEEDLQKIQRNLSEAQRIAKIGSWDMDAQTGEGYWSDELYRLLGYSPDEIEASYALFRKHVHPDDLHIFDESISQYVSSAKQINVVYKYITRSGETRIAQSIGKVEFDNSGQPVRTWGTFQDITEQKEAEQALKESEERLNEAQLIAEMGDFTLHIRTGAVEWSDAMYTLLGYDKHEEIDFAKVNETIHHPDDLPRITKWVNECIAATDNTPRENEYRLLKKDGTVIDARVIIRTEREDEKPVRLFGTVQDITERKQTESRMRESEEKFRKLYENSPYGIIINQITRDAHGNPVDFIHQQANHSASVQLGMSLSDLVGTTATEIADEETAAKFIHLYGEVVRTGTPCNFDYYFNHHDRTLNVTAFHLTGDMFITNFVDITDRKQSEEELRESEERYRKIFNNSAVALWEMDFSAVREYLEELKKRRFKNIHEKIAANPEWIQEFQSRIRLLNINKTTQSMFKADSRDALYRSFGKLTTEDSVESFLRCMKDFDAGKTNYYSEQRHKTVDGEDVIVDLSATIIPGSEDTWNRILITLTDITERKRTESTLISSLEFSQNLIETANAIVLTLDIEANITTFNDFAARLTGYAKEEVLGKNWFQHFIPDRNGTAIPKVFKKVLAQMPDVSAYENPILCKSGEERLIAWKNTVTRDEDGKITGVLSIGIDITDQKAAEEERDRILTLSSDLICIAGMDGYFKYLNPAWEKTLGYSVEEMLVKPFLDFIHSDDHTKNDDEVRSLSEGKESINFENRYVCKDGSLRTISWRATPLPESQLMYCIGRDITDKKKIEEELAKHREHLEDLVRERTAEIEEKNTQLERMNQLFVGREFRIKELRDKITELESKSDPARSS